MSPGIIKIKSRSLTNTENRDTSSLITYQAEMEKVVRLVNRVADSALFGTKKKERAFQSMHETDLEKGARSLKVSWYEDTASSTTTCTPSVIYGAHTDYEAWTVLAPDPNDREGGRGVGWSPPLTHTRKEKTHSEVRTFPHLAQLQIYLREEKAWSDTIPFLFPDAFILNAGDFVERWTGGKWKSALHRVVSSSSPDDLSPKGRLTIPYFVGCDENRDIEPLFRDPFSSSSSKKAKEDYPKVKAGEYLRMKISLGSTAASKL